MGKFAYQLATDADIDAIIAGEYEDDGKDDSCVATDADIDMIIAGTFMEGK